MHSAGLIDCYVHISDDDAVGEWDAGSRYAKVPLASAVLQFLSCTCRTNAHTQKTVALAGFFQERSPRLQVSVSDPTVQGMK